MFEGGRCWVAGWSRALWRALVRVVLVPVTVTVALARQVWSTIDGHCKIPCSGWLAVPPDGYVTMGIVFVRSITMSAEEVLEEFTTKSVSPFKCVRRDLVTEATMFEGWVDQFSGSRESDLNLYVVHNPVRTCVARLQYYELGQQPTQDRLLIKPVTFVRAHVEE